MKNQSKDCTGAKFAHLGVRCSKDGVHRGMETHGLCRRVYINIQTPYHKYAVFEHVISVVRFHPLGKHI